MKTSNHTKQPVPDIRNNIDSRTGEEQEYKGDDATHNRKQHHSENKNVIYHLNRKRSNSKAAGL